MEDLFLLMIAVWYECAFYGRVSARVECGASWHVMISRLSTAFCMYLGYIPMVFWIATPSFHNHIKHYLSGYSRICLMTMKSIPITTNIPPPWSTQIENHLHITAILCTGQTVCLWTALIDVKPCVSSSWESS